jgi:anti-sigma factor RsiW
MTKLTEEMMVDYVDGGLSPVQRAKVEAYLAAHPEEAELVENIRFAMGATKEWHEEEPLRVSENFWPNLREQLGPPPQRSPWRKFANQVSGLFGTRAAGRISVGAAFAAIVIAMAFSAFGPERGRQVATASLTAQDKAFIHLSKERHEAYMRSAPLVPGDARSVETGADDSNEEVNP